MCTIRNTQYGNKRYRQTDTDQRVLADLNVLTLTFIPKARTYGAKARRDKSYAKLVQEQPL